MITFDDFQKVELRTAEVIGAEPHPNADRLIVLQLALGEERRQIVAGIKGHYEPDTLVGRTIVIVANLEPRPLRGVESQGMLLAVRDGDDVRLVGVDGGAPGGLAVS